MAARTAYPAGGNPTTTSKAISFVYPDSGGQVAPNVNDSLVIFGVTVAEVVGTSPVNVRLHDGTDTTGPVLVSQIKLLASGFQYVALGSGGVQVSSGKVFAEISGGGSAEIVVYW